MTVSRTSGIVAERLSADALAQYFGDLHAPLEPHEASVAADRCYFCHDAPLRDGLSDGYRYPAFYSPDQHWNTRSRC